MGKGLIPNNVCFWEIGSQSQNNKIRIVLTYNARNNQEYHDNEEDNTTDNPDCKLSYDVHGVCTHVNITPTAKQNMLNDLQNKVHILVTQKLYKSKPHKSICS